MILLNQARQVSYNHFHSAKFVCVCVCVCVRACVRACVCALEAINIATFSKLMDLASLLSQKYVGINFS